MCRTGIHKILRILQTLIYLFVTVLKTLIFGTQMGGGFTFWLRTTKLFLDKEIYSNFVSLMTINERTVNADYDPQ